MKLCNHCHKHPRMTARTYCAKCNYKHKYQQANRPVPVNSEYKIGRFGFVYLRVGDEWKKSSLTPYQVRLLAGERLAA